MTKKLNGKKTGNPTTAQVFSHKGHKSYLCKYYYARVAFMCLFVVDHLKP